MIVQNEVVRNDTDPTRWGASARSSQTRAVHAARTPKGPWRVNPPPVARQRGLRSAKNQVAVSSRFP